MSRRWYARHIEKKKQVEARKRRMEAAAAEEVDAKKPRVGADGARNNSSGAAAVANTVEHNADNKT